MSITESLINTAEHIQLHKKEDLERVVYRSYHENGWFVPQNCYQAWNNCMTWLTKKSLQGFMEKYPTTQKPQKIGVIAAGNIPMVGFHDVLMVILSGHQGIIKLSHQDKYLIPFFIQTWEELYPQYREKVIFTEDFIHLKPDKVIATGSNNTARYFEYYFRNTPTLIRKNRFSVAVLQGNESEEILEKLGYDCFDYFGLGCRNVSHIFLPQGYEPVHLCPFLERYPNNKDHDKWLNNYTYHKAILLMNLDYNFFDGGFFILREMPPRSNPPSMVGYSFYSDEEDLQNKLSVLKEEIQIVLYAQDFGTAQYPDIGDFADDINTMEFLLQ